MLKAGDLRHLVTLEDEVVTKGSSGGVNKSWVPVLADVPAHVVNQSGTERQATSQGGIAAAATLLIRIRYEPGLHERMRIVYEGKYYNIQHINNVQERDVLLAITATTGLNHG